MPAWVWGVSCLVCLIIGIVGYTINSNTPQSVGPLPAIAFGFSLITFVAFIAKLVN